MKYIHKFFIGIFILGLLSVSSCVEPEGTVPFAKVNFSVSVENGNLVHVGGHEYYTGGVSGVIVYRLDMTNFCAYDRACPYDWKEDGYVVYDPTTLLLTCRTCGSTFNILNGYPMEGSKTGVLRMYQTRMINDFTLHVYN